MTTNPFWKTAANAGIVLGLAIVLIAHAGYLWGNLGTASWVGYLNWIAMFTVQYYFIRHLKMRFNEGYLRYWRGVSLGVVISLFSAVLYALYFFVLIKTNPTYMDQMMQITADTLVQSGFAEKEVSKMVAMFPNYMTPGTILFSSLLSLGFLGFIFSLIVSALLRKNKPIFES